MLSRRFAAVVTIVVVIAFVVVAVAPAFATAPAAPGSFALHARLASSAPKDGASVESAEQVDGAKVVTGQVVAADVKGLRQISDDVKNRLAGPSAVVLAAALDGLGERIAARHFVRQATRRTAETDWSTPVQAS